MSYDKSVMNFKYFISKKTDDKNNWDILLNFPHDCCLNSGKRKTTGNMNIKSSI